MKKTNSLLFYSRCLLAVFAVLGTTIQLVKYGFGMILYYTVQSNFLISLFSIYMVMAMLQKKDLQQPKFLRIKAAATMSIMITFVIYHFMLAPLAKDFWRVENFLCHYITPLYFFFDTLFVDSQRQYKWYDPLWWTALPVGYMFFALLNGLVLKFPIPDAVDSPFAYYFLNVYKYGWGYVLRYAAVIFVAYLLAGYLLFFLKSLSFKKKADNPVKAEQSIKKG